MVPSEDSSVGGARTGETGVRELAPTGLKGDRRGSVPLRIAPLIVVGLILVVMAVIGATTL